MEKGLTTAQVHQQLKKFGYNEFVTKKEYTALKILISQFTSFFIIILIVTGTISILLGEIIDGSAIFAIVVINSMIGFFQEYKAENAVKTLKQMMVPKTVVVRNGQEMEIAVREVVPDDVVILAEGDRIPADMKILEAFSLKIDESMLTGESVPANKTVGKDKEGMLFEGTMITTGRAVGRVISTGMNTEFGKIVNLVSRQQETRSPLAIQLDSLGKKVGLVILILIAITFILGALRNFAWVEMLMISVALGVSAIPEGLPIIVSLTLSMGVQILARKKAIVRKMNSIETLGATTIICSDKTGTLTLNEMTVKKVNTSFKEVNIPGHGYDFKEKIKLASTEEKKLLEICENCNNSFVDKNILGDPTEIALKVLARKARYVKAYKELDENIFTSERKMMSSLHSVSGKKEIMAKGAFEEILKNCSHILKGGKVVKLTAKDKKEYEKIAESYAKEALRVLAFAYKKYTTKFDEKNLIFVGLVGMLDPPRKTVKNSIEIAQQAGINVKIITGDNAVTAQAIGKKIGLKITGVVTGDEIDKMNDSQLKKTIYANSIFARTSPQHKYRIVDLLKKNHEVIAVTGDGVNDAPALKHADVGIAMGIKGTEATKEVADIVLKDDNFTTIITTIEEGRRIYNNILSFIKYMLSVNYASITTVATLALFAFPLPMLPLQVLWINIATDALPALALGKSPAKPGIMQDKPHPKKENIFKKFLGLIITAVLFQTLVNLAIYFYGLELDTQAGLDINNLDVHSHARTFVFTQIVLFELFFVFVCKDEKITSIKSLFSNKAIIWAVATSFALQLIMIYTPFMQDIFKTVPLTLTEWLILALGASTAFLVPSTTHLIRKIFKNN